MDKVRTLKPQATLPPEKAAEVALLRDLTERYITGEIAGMCVMWADAEGMPCGNDLLGVMDAGYLHIELHSLADEIRAGFKGGEDA